MAATIYNLDTANLFVGDDDPNTSQFLVLNSVKLPMLEETTKTHMPGGGVVAIDIGTRKVNAPTMSFKLAGLNPDVMPKFMSTPRSKYTVRGNLFDVRAQLDLPVVGVVEGKMTKVDINEFKKDSDVGSDYEIKEVVFYQLMIAGKEKFYFDMFAGPGGVRIDGQQIFRQVALNVGLGV